jgi:hypothetical protein
MHTPHRNLRLYLGLVSYDKSNPSRVSRTLARPETPLYENPGYQELTVRSRERLSDIYFT